jgi:uncharacterized membrane protein
MHSQREDSERVRPKFRALLSLVVGGVLVLYPVLVYFGHTYLGATWMAPALIAICAARLVALPFGSAGPVEARALGAPQLIMICGGAIVLALVSMWRNSPDAMLYYPVLVNAVMLLLFAASLAYPPTVVERIARLRDRNLPDKAVPYLRRVTIAWCIFFVGNGAIALYTATRTSLAAWTLYNGLIAYLLIGAMFGGELLTRRTALRGLRR